MDPNSPAPTPTPEQTPTPVASAPVQTPAPQPVQQATDVGTGPATGGQPPKKLGTGAILGIVGGVLFVILLVVGIFVVANMLGKGNTDKAATNDSSKTNDTKKDDSTLREANAVTAESMSDLGTVCQNGSVKNAAAFAKPYKFAVFDNNSVRGSWSNFSLSYNNESAVKYSDFAQANVIVCLDRDDSTAVKSTTCDFKTGGEAVTVDFYAVKYKTTLYEAQTGKKIKELAAVNGPASKCPSFVSYDKTNPKIYGDADKAELEANLAAFAQ